MGIICSSVPTINTLHFLELPSSRPVVIEKVVRCGRTYIMKGKNGRLYSNSVGKYAYVPGKWPWMNDTMKALVKLGIITKEQMQVHLDHCKKNEQIRDKKHARETMKRLTNDFGIKFTRNQMKAVAN